MRHHGTQVGEQAERLAQLQQALLRPHRGVRIRPLRTAHGSQKNRVRAPAQLERGRRQRLARGIDGRAAHQGAVELEGMAEALSQALERAQRLGGDFAADAVARDDRDQGAQSALPCRFVALDVPELAAQIAELIHAVEQAVAGKGLDGEADRARGRREAQ